MRGKLLFVSIPTAECYSLLNAPKNGEFNPWRNIMGTNNIFDVHRRETNDSNDKQSTHPEKFNSAVRTTAIIWAEYSKFGVDKTTFQSTFFVFTLSVSISIWRSVLFPSFDVISIYNKWARILIMLGITNMSNFIQILVMSTTCIRLHSC